MIVDDSKSNKKTDSMGFPVDMDMNANSSKLIETINTEFLNGASENIGEKGNTKAPGSIHGDSFPVGFVKIVSQRM